MTNAIETLERIKRVKDELDSINKELVALNETTIYEVNDIPLIIGFLEERFGASSEARGCA